MNNLYGVEVRDMRTAIHNLFVTNTKRKAEKILTLLKKIENTNEEHLWNDISALCQDSFEINYRDIKDDCMYDDVYVINHFEVKPDVYC